MTSVSLSAVEGCFARCFDAGGPVRSARQLNVFIYNMLNKYVNDSVAVEVRMHTAKILRPPMLSISRILFQVGVNQDLSQWDRINKFVVRNVKRGRKRGVAGRVVVCLGTCLDPCTVSIHRTYRQFLSDEERPALIFKGQFNTLFPQYHITKLGLTGGGFGSIQTKNEFVRNGDWKPDKRFVVMKGIG